MAHPGILDAKTWNFDNGDHPMMTGIIFLDSHRRNVMIWLVIDRKELKLIGWFISRVLN